MYSFGIDVGGTTIKIGLIKNKDLIDFYEIKTRIGDNGKMIFSDIAESINKYLNDKGILLSDVRGFGFGIPGNIVNNKITFCANLKVFDLDLKSEFEKYFKGKVIIGQNDANVAALGELVATKKYHNAVLLTLGTGVGGGVVINDKVIEGYHGACGEIGHMIIDDKYKFNCGCGNAGCLETICSATGIVRLANYYFEQYPDTTIDMLNVSAKSVIDAAKNNDPLGLKVLDIVGFYLAKAMSYVAICVDPEVFIIGGGVSNAGEVLISAINKHYNKFAYSSLRNPSIIIASLKNKAGMLGAGLLV